MSETEGRDLVQAFETRQIHAGATVDAETYARATPIYQTTSYVLGDAEHAADTFALRDKEAHAYTRLSNPTTAVVEQRIADLEGGVGAVALADGQAAIALALLTIAETGDHVVASVSRHAESRTLFARTFAHVGIAVDFVTDPDDLAQWRAAIRPNTRALFAEALGAPLGNVLDIAAVAEVAHAAGVPLIVENTLATPYLLRPLVHGADVVTHSTTAFLSGHGVAQGGVVIDGGRFDFAAEPDRWPQLLSPDPSYHGLVYADEFGELAYATRLRTGLLRDLGPAPSPLNSFLLLQGLETLSLRVARHSENAQAVAEWLEARPEVARVHYAGLPSSRWHDAAKRYLPCGAGGVLAFEPAGGEAAARALVDRLRLFSRAGAIGEARSAASVYGQRSTTHAKPTPRRKTTGGGDVIVGPPAGEAPAGGALDGGAVEVSTGVVRLSVGLEGVDDLIADLAEGLRG